LEIVRIALQCLALDDRSFDLGFARRYEALQRSIGEVGVLQPLLTRPRPADTKYQIVCGFGRALVARGLSVPEIPIVALDAAITDADCLRLALFDNLPHRQFNPIERAIILTKLGQHVDRDRLVSDYMPLLGMQPGATLFHRTVALMGLVDRLKWAVAEGRIEEKVGVALSSLSPSDQEVFARFLERCQPSVSIAREWAEALVAVARRDNRTLLEVAMTPEVAAILESEEMTRGERTAALRRHFQRLRYPTVSARETRFDEAKAVLRLPPSMRLEPAPSFESDEISLEIRFRNEAELRDALVMLEKWFDDPDLLKRLWQTRAEPDRD